MNVSMRNTVRNGEELFELIQMGLNSHLSVMSITNAYDVAPFLMPELGKYRVINKNYFQMENLKVVPGIFLWCTYSGSNNIPILGYDFDPLQVHVDLENSLMKMKPNQKYLSSHQAIDIIKNAGGKIFLATSNMHPIPSLEKLDEILAHHYSPNNKIIDGLEVMANNFSKADTIMYHNYAKENGLLITGGDNYRYGEPKNGFAKIQLPENYESNWLLHL